MRNIFKTLLVGFLIGTQALAASTPTKFPTDQLGFGKSASIADHFMFFDFGTFSTNPRLTVDSATKTLFYNKNNFSLGDGTNTAKTFTANIGGSNPYLQYNPTNSQWEFSNDGTNAAGFGSGSGSGTGVNLLVNSGFESGVSQGWSVTGGTLASVNSGANLLIEKKSATWTATAGSQNFVSTAYTVANGIAGHGCAAGILYKGGDANLTLQAYDGTNVLVSQVLAASTGAIPAKVFFPCPASGTVQLRIVSSAAASLIALDSMFLGEPGLNSVTQASVVANMYFPRTSSCSWTTTSGSLAAFATVAACPAPVVEYSSGIGTPLTTDTDLPKVTINNLPAGLYQVTATGAGYQTGGSGHNSLAISDGTTVSASHGSVAATTGASGEFSVNGVFNYTSQGNHTFELFGATSSNTLSIDNDSGNYQMNFLIKRFPSVPVELNTPDVVAWRVNASQTSATSWPMSATDVSTATFISGSDGALTANTSKGSAAAYQPCAGSEVASGSTCTGNEEVGISFFIPRAGTVRVCSQYGHRMNAAASTEAAVVFQLVETPNNDDATVSQYGKGTAQSTLGNGSGGGATVHPVYLCGDFKFDSAGQKTIRNYYTMDQSGGSVTENIIIADQIAPYNGREITWTAEYVDQQTPVPVMSGSIVTKGSGVTKFVSVSFAGNSAGTTACTSDPCTIVSQSGGVTVCNRGGAGNYDCVLEAGIFAAKPRCNVSGDPNFSPNVGLYNLTSATATSVRISLVDAAGSPGDGIVSVNCSGE